MQLPGDAREHYIAAHAVGGRADAARPAAEPPAEHRRATCSPRPRPDRCSAMWRDHDEAFITIGFGGLPEARALERRRRVPRRVARRTAGCTSIASRGTAAKRWSRAARWTRWPMAGVDERSRLGCISWRRLRTRPSATCIAPRSTASGDPVRVTPRTFTGSNSYTISPDGRFAFHRFSRFDNPGIRELVTLPDHKSVAMMDDNAALKQKSRRCSSRRSSTSRRTPATACWSTATCSSRRTSTPSKRYPVLVLHLRRAGRRRRSRIAGAAPTALYHRHLASLGYLVVSFDNAGTPAPRGRAWRKADLRRRRRAVVEAAGSGAALARAARPYVDLDRVGGVGLERRRHQHAESDVPLARPVQGRHGGRAGSRSAALRHDLPGTLHGTARRRNAEGYKQASAINFAEGLKGDLLIVHGSGDDNVHYQGTELLVNRLIELGKPFDFMTYPGSDARDLRGTGHDAAPLSPADALSHDAPAGRTARVGHQVAHSDVRRRAIYLDRSSVGVRAGAAR